jgi:hypothetical protein
VRVSTVRDFINLKLHDSKLCRLLVSVVGQKVVE